VVLLLSGLYYRYNMKQQIANLSREKAESEQKLDKAVDILKKQLKFTEKKESEDFEPWIADNLKQNKDSLHKLQELLASSKRTAERVFLASFLSRLQGLSLKKMTQTVSANEAYIQVQNRNYKEINFFRGNVIGEQQLQDEKYEKRFLEVVVQVYGENTSHPIMTYTYKGGDRPSLAVESSDETDLASQVWLRREQNKSQPASSAESNSVPELLPTQVKSAEKSKHSPSQEKNSLLDIKITSISRNLCKQVEKAVRALPLTTFNEENGLLTLDPEEWVRGKYLQRTNSRGPLYYNNNRPKHDETDTYLKNKFFNPAIFYLSSEMFARVVDEVNIFVEEKKLKKVDFHGLHVHSESFHTTWKQLNESKDDLGRNPLYYPFEKVEDSEYLTNISDDDKQYEKTKQYLITPKLLEGDDSSLADAGTTATTEESKDLSPENKTDGVVEALESAWKKIKDALISNYNIQLTHLDLSDSNIPEKFFHEIVGKHKAKLKVVKCDNVLRTVPLNLGSLPECPNLEVLHCNYYLYRDFFSPGQTDGKANTKNSPFATSLIAQAAWKVFADAYNVSEKKQFQNLIELSMNIEDSYSDLDDALRLLVITNGVGSKLTKFNGHNVVVKTNNGDVPTRQYYAISDEMQTPSTAANASAAKKVCSRCGYPKRAPSSH
jgi:hypothetical protein